jgi:hypothetical protein
MTGHPPGRVTVSVWLPIVMAGTVSRRAGQQALDHASHTHSLALSSANGVRAHQRSGPTPAHNGRDLNQMTPGPGQADHGQ